VAREELGRIKKPSVDSYTHTEGQRRLYVVPLLLGGASIAGQEYHHKLKKYWKQVESQLNNLQQKLGPASNIYCELVAGTPEEILEGVARMSASLRALVDQLIESGGSIQSIENPELLEQHFDWMRCMAVNLQSTAAQQTIMQFLMDSINKRQKIISEAIEGNLGPGETGIFFTSMHDTSTWLQAVEVFKILPPVLDELEHLLHEHPEG
jgi:hypothetical protein